jgi:hypothetical protein
MGGDLTHNLLRNADTLGRTSSSFVSGLDGGIGTDLRAGVDEGLGGGPLAFGLREGGGGGALLTKE